MAQGATRTSRVNRDAHKAMRTAIQKRYTLLTKIAQGERTEVYMARPHGGGAGPVRPVALKCLKPELTLNSDGIGFLRHEAWVSSQLHHAYLTRCIEVIETTDSCCVVQNYVEGEDLSHLLQSGSQWSQERYIAPLLVDVLEGLHALHTALDDQSWPLLLWHGGIRARHVLVGVDGIARLTDFSHARSRRGHVSAQTDIPAQARYMAPEQARDPESIDHRSDLFLVGVMLWEALTGMALFAAQNEALTLQHLLRRPVLPPSKVGLRPSACFDEICLRALHRDPDKRYDTALDMACALRDAALNAGLCATRAELGAWVRVVSCVEEDENDEPTAQFARSPHSDMREIARAPGESPTVVNEEPATSPTPYRAARSPRMRAS